MLILTTMLTMVFYWISFGIAVAAFLFLMYGIALIFDMMFDSL